MFWMMNGWNREMGPRGPIYGHRGYGRRGLGLGGLFLLPALFFGGWMVIAVIGGLIGTMAWILGGAFSGIGSLIGWIFSLIESAFTSEGLVVGIVLGIVLFYWMKKRNSAAQSET